MSHINVECYHSVEKFLANLKNFDVCSNPFESYAFMSVFMKYKPDGNFYFFNIYEDDNIIAIIPFECYFESNLLNVKKIRFIGYRQFNYEQYICKDTDVEKVHCTFMDYLSSQKHNVLINFYDINDGSILYLILQSSPLKKSVNKLYLCPCLHFTDSFDDFFKEVFTASKKRAELKKFQKRLAEIGNFRIVNVDDEQLYTQNLDYLNQIYRVHRERFADVYATSFFGSEKMRPYYSELIESLMKDNKGYISLLLMDEVVIAFIFCLTNGETLIDWIPAFDPAYAKYSLGLVQYKMIFEKMCGPKISYKVFDYSKGSSVYKRKWAKEETANYQFVVNLCPKSIVLSILYFFDKEKFAFKVFLREKGILVKIKRAIGAALSLTKQKEMDSSNVTINYVAVFQDSSTYQFQYKDILAMPVKFREEIISSIFKGGIVKSVEVSGNDTVVTILNKAL